MCAGRRCGKAPAGAQQGRARARARKRRRRRGGDGGGGAGAGWDAARGEGEGVGPGQQQPHRADDARGAGLPGGGGWPRGGGGDGAAGSAIVSGEQRWVNSTPWACPSSRTCTGSCVVVHGQIGGRLGARGAAGGWRGGELPKSAPPAGGATRRRAQALRARRAVRARACGPAARRGDVGNAARVAEAVGELLAHPPAVEQNRRRAHRRAPGNQAPLGKVEHRDGDADAATPSSCSSASAMRLTRSVPPRVMRSPSNTRKSASGGCAPMVTRAQLPELAGSRPPAGRSSARSRARARGARPRRILGAEQHLAAGVHTSTGISARAALGVEGAGVVSHVGEDEFPFSELWAPGQFCPHERIWERGPGRAGIIRYGLSAGL